MAALGWSADFRDPDEIDPATPCAYCGEATDGDTGRCLCCARAQCSCCLEWKLDTMPTAHLLATGETMTDDLCGTCAEAGRQ